MITLLSIITLAATATFIGSLGYTAIHNDMVSFIGFMVFPMFVEAGFEVYLFLSKETDEIFKERSHGGEDFLAEIREQRLRARPRRYYRTGNRKQDKQRSIHYEVRGYGPGEQLYQPERRE